MDDAEQSREQYRQVEKSAREVAKMVYERELKKGATKAQAARAAGLAAGHVAADRDLSPADAAKIAGDAVRENGGKLTDIVDAAWLTTKRANGNYGDLAQAMGELVSEDNLLEEEGRHSDYVNKEIWHRYNTGKISHKEAEAREAEYRRQNPNIQRQMISRIFGSAKAAGASVEEIGRAIGAAFKGYDPARLIKQVSVELYFGSGKGLFSRHDVIKLLAQILLSKCLDKKKVKWILKDEVEEDLDELRALDKYLDNQKNGGKPGASPKTAPKVKP